MNVASFSRCGEIEIRLKVLQEPKNLLYDRNIFDLIIPPLF